MSFQLSGKDRNLLLGAGFVFVLLIVIALLFDSDEQGQGKDPSSYSTASGGAKAAYLLLSEAGYKVQRWEQPLNGLPLGKTQAITLILAEPEEAPTREERERLKAFISEGGHVIATGMFGGTFLPQNDSFPDLLPRMTSKTASSLSPSRITRAAPQIVLAPRAYWRSASAAYPLYGDGEHTLVVKYALGRGEVLWWASATPLTNAGLKEVGNLEFFLACLSDQKLRDQILPDQNPGDQPKDQPEIFFDEYVHGYRQTLAASIVHSPVKWLLFQLALLAAAVVATFSRRSGPTCVPSIETRLSPIEFVETLGGLYQRAGTPSIAVDICYRRFRYWLTRRLGVAGDASVESLATAVHDRWGLTADNFIATMKHCESARLDPFLSAPVALHLLQELDEYATQLKLFQSRREKA